MCSERRGLPLLLPSLSKILEVSLSVSLLVLLLDETTSVWAWEPGSTTESWLPDSLGEGYLDSDSKGEAGWWSTTCWSSSA